MKQKIVCFVQVKARHVDSVFEMLKELDVVNTREEAEERCFFYSGREALDLALDDKGKYTVYPNFTSHIVSLSYDSSSSVEINSEL